MTVRELIEKLQEFPPDRPVIVDGMEAQIVEEDQYSYDGKSVCVAVIIEGYPWGITATH